MGDTFIKLYRGLLDWEWFGDSKMVHLYIYLLIKANYTDANWRGQEIKRGQLVTGLDSLHKQTGISKQSLRTCLERLKLTKEINIESTNKFSLITIVKYEEYQSFDSKPTRKQQTTNNQSTFNQQQVKNNKEEKEIMFNTFWGFYPNKVAKEKCKEKFLKLEPNEISQILATIQNWAKYKPFESYSHPNPETYLNQKRWQDVIPEVKKTFIDISGQS